MATSVVKYAFYLLIFAFVVGGAYWTGHRVGSSDAKVEYVTKEVIKYVEVEKEKSAIYSAPNIDRDTALRMYAENKF